VGILFAEAPHMIWKKEKKRKRKHRRRRSSSKVRALEKFVVEEIEVTDVPAQPVGPKPKHRRHKEKAVWLPDIKVLLGWLVLLIVLVGSTFFMRSLWPLDETRVTAVAWEMWSRGDWLLPRLNGSVIVSGPLISWLIIAGWQFAGTVDWVPRIIPPIFVLLNLILVRQIAIYLWPGRDEIGRYAPLILLGTFFWSFFATLALPDMLTVFFVQLALLALLMKWRLQSRFIWLVLLSLSLLLGMLSSGLVILIYVLPLILLVPIWGGEEKLLPLGKWFGGSLVATLVGFAGLVAWLYLASKQTDTTFINDYLISKSVTGAYSLFDQNRPWWWSLLLLSLLALPWIVWPLVWMRLWYIRSSRMTSGLVFCMVWSVPAIVILILLGNGQPQFLLPLYPAFSLAVTYLLFDDELTHYGQDRGYSTMSIPIIFAGGIMIVLPSLPQVEILPAFLWLLSPFAGFGVVGLGILLSWLPVPEVKKRIVNLAVGSVILTTAALAFVGWKFEPQFNLAAIATFIGHEQSRGTKIGHVGDYQGQFHFAGRLKQPIQVIKPDQALDWLPSHPRALLITYADNWSPPSSRARPVIDAPYRHTRVQIWEAATITR